MTQPNILKKNPHSTLLQFSSVKAKLVLSPTVVEQIKYLCAKMPTVEWSGVLYHTSTGDIDDPSTFVCRAEYIMLLNKGTAGYTTHSFDSPFFTEALLEKPEFTNGDWSMSLIHSHNSMSVFFSGPDCEELTDNAANFNYYLSLIVNNKNEYCARIAFIGEIEGRTIKFNGKNGLAKDIKVPNQTCTFYHDVEVSQEKSSLIDEFFVKQYEKVTVPPAFQTFPSFGNQGKGLGQKQTSKSQQEFTFDDDYKWDHEASAFLKWLLSKHYESSFLTVKEALDSVNPDTLKGREFILAQIDDANVIYEFFVSDPAYDVNSDLHDVWIATIMLLEKSNFKNHKTAIALADEMNKWIWE